MLHKTLKKHLPQYDTLDHEFSIFIPSTVHVDKPLDDETHAKIADLVSTMMSRRFGGATVHKGHGSWLDENKRLVREPVYVVTSAAKVSSPADALEHLLHVKGIAKYLALLMNQSSVLVRHHSKDDGTHNIFVGQDYPYTHSYIEYHRKLDGSPPDKDTKIHDYDGLHHHTSEFVKIAKLAHGLNDFDFDNTEKVLSNARQRFHSTLDRESVDKIRNAIGQGQTQE